MIKKLFLITIFFVTNFLLAQTKEEKVKSILNNLGYVKGYTYNFNENIIKPLKEKADRKDSLKLIELQNILTDKEIEKRLGNSYIKFFNDDEINTLYKFYNTSAGKKSVKNQHEMEGKFKENFYDINREIAIVKEHQINEEANVSNYITEFFEKEIDRPNGFYLVSEEKDENGKRTLNVAEKPSITIDDIKEVTSNFNDLGEPTINILLNENGKKKFLDLTTINVNKGVAIIVNKKVLSMPVISSAIPDGKVQIRGGFTVKEVENIVHQLRNK